MQVVGSGFNRNIYLGTGVHAIFRRIDGALYFELFDGFDGGRETHGVDARLGRNNAIHGDALLDVTLAIGGDLYGLAGDRRTSGAAGPDATGAESDSRHQRRQLREVAPIQRQLDDALGFHHGAKRCVFRAKQRRRGCNLDHLGAFSDLQMKIKPELLLKLKR